MHQRNVQGEVTSSRPTNITLSYPPKKNVSNEQR